MVAVIYIGITKDLEFALVVMFQHRLKKVIYRVITKITGNIGYANTSIRTGGHRADLNRLESSFCHLCMLLSDLTRILTGQQVQGVKQAGRSPGIERTQRQCLTEGVSRFAQQNLIQQDQAQVKPSPGFFGIQLYGLSSMCQS